MVFINNKTSMEGIPGVVAAHMGTQVCTMAVAAGETVGVIAVVITEGLPEEVPMVRMVCIVEPTE